ncbi:NAC domain-containing protein [Psidium guajava]|nr:NAC domain-containing protein [Psidium guajava]
MLTGATRVFFVDVGQGGVGTAGRQAEMSCGHQTSFGSLTVPTAHDGHEGEDGTSLYIVAILISRSLHTKGKKKEGNRSYRTNQGLRSFFASAAKPVARFLTAENLSDWPGCVQRYSIAQL